MGRLRRVERAWMLMMAHEVMLWDEARLGVGRSVLGSGGTGEAGIGREHRPERGVWACWRTFPGCVSG